MDFKIKGKQYCFILVIYAVILLPNKLLHFMEIPSALTYQSPTKKMYWIAIVSVVLIIAINQLLIYNLISKKNKDASTINLAGRQRMLSEQIVKTAYKCISDSTKLSQLQVTAQGWNATHNQLSNHFFTKEDEQLTALFKQIEPYQSQLYKTVIQLTTIKNVSNNLLAIDNMQVLYLEKMEQIVKRFEQISTQKLNDIFKWEIILGIISVLILFAELLFIFIPMAKKINRQLDALKKQNAELEKVAFIQSHELRRPVSSILGLVDLIEDENLNPETKEIMMHIKAATKELDVVVHTIVQNTNKVIVKEKATS
jgi:two-component system, chemotaxis family, sensor kinase Cph1